MSRAALGRLLAALGAGALALAVAATSRPGQAGLVALVGLAGLAALALATVAGRRDAIGAGVGLVAVALAVGQSPANAALAVEAAGLLAAAELSWWATEHRPAAGTDRAPAARRWTYIAGLCGAAVVLGLAAWGAGQARALGLVALAAGTVAAVSAVSITWSLTLRARR